MVVIVLGVAALSSGELAFAAGPEDVPKTTTPSTSTLSEAGGSDPEANLPFLFAVYLITWAGFFGCTFVMSRRQREMRRELDALKTAIAGKDA